MTAAASGLVASWQRLGPLLLILLGFACSGRPPIATLKELQGAVERDWATRLGLWSPAERGTTFALGDGVRTRDAGAALLHLDDGTRLELGADTTIRFSPTRPESDAHAFDVETGVATLQAGNEDVAVLTSIGLARIERGAIVVMAPSAEGLRFEVRVGRAVFGGSEALEAGAEVTLDARGVAASPSARDSLARANLELADPTGAITAHVRGRGAVLRRGQAWSPLAEGAVELASGSELETADHTSVEIESAGQHAILGENGHYRLAPRQGVFVTASRGEVLAGGSAAVRVEVPGGVILIAPGGHARLGVGPDATSVEVRSREAVIETGERSQAVGAGHSAVISRSGGVSMRPGASGAPGSEPPRNDAIEVTDIEIATGTSVVIHDPSPPTAVRFGFEGVCPEQARLQLRSGRKLVRQGLGLGAGSVALSVPQGKYRYELRCGDERRGPRRAGHLTVLADAATRRIAAKPPRVSLLADGRKYTVLYQNRLPEVSLAWPNASAPSGVRLVHEVAGARRTLALDANRVDPARGGATPVPAAPRYDFAPGDLREGSHTFYFEGGGAVSRQTRVDIVFDNAAPRAALDGPLVLDARPGDELTISGTALPGSQVSVEGRRVRLDGGGRFQASTRLPEQRRALAVTLVQPGRGTHIYLRRGKSE